MKRDDLVVEVFDLTQVHPEAKGFSGAVFDGRFIYLVPLNNGQFQGRVLRFDPQGQFDDPSAWASFDSASVNANSRGFVNGMFDGRYLYLIPYFNGRHHGLVTRYDTQAAFDAPDSWQFFDTGQLHPNCRGFVSGCFDGRYVYLSPYQLDFTATHGQVTRFDSQGDFLDAAAWETFDACTLHPDSRGFHSALHDGDYVYFVPYLNTGKEYSGLIARYDRRLPFASPAAWKHLELSNLNPGCKGYVGGCVHQGYLFLSPYIDGIDRHGRVLRYDPRHAGFDSSELDDTAVWRLFDTAQIDPDSRGFFGAIGAGDRLFMVPHCRGVGQYHGLLTYCELGNDGQGFVNAANWSTFDLAGINPNLRGFIGGVVHGDWLYLPPFETDAGQHSGLMARVNLDF
jgi:hypothetical protein